MSFLEWEVLIGLIAFVLGISRVLSGVRRLSVQLSNFYLLTALGKPSLDQSIDPDDPSRSDLEHYESLELWKNHAYYHRLSLGMSPFQAAQSVFDFTVKYRQLLSKDTPQRIYNGCYMHANTCPECQAAIAKAKEEIAKAEEKLNVGEEVSFFEWPMTISKCRPLAKEYPSASTSL